MNPATVLAFDVGARRIGVAVGNTISNTARELGLILVHAHGPDWISFDRMVREWKPDLLVVGDPLDSEGEGMQPARKVAHDFAKQAFERSGIKIAFVDERRSSIEATARFAKARQAGVKRRRDAQELDALAAVIILERWLHHPDARLAHDDL